MALRKAQTRPVGKPARGTAFPPTEKCGHGTVLCVPEKILWAHTTATSHNKTAAGLRAGVLCVHKTIGGLHGVVLCVHGTIPCIPETVSGLPETAAWMPEGILCVPEMVLCLHKMILCLDIMAVFAAG